MKRALTSAAATTLLLSASFLAAGCGGDDDNFRGTVLNSASTITVTSTASYNGTYAGTTTLDNGQVARYNLIVSANNQVTGSVTVGTQANRSNVAISNGTYTVSGSLDPNTGNFSLTSNTNFSMTGTLPLNGRAGNFTLVINGEVYTGTLDPSGFTSSTSSGTVTTSSTSSSSGGSAGRSGQITNVAISNFAFTPTSGYNGPTLTSSPLQSSGFYDDRKTTSKGQFGVALVYGLAGTNIQGLVVGAQTSGEALAVGQEFPVVTTADAGNSPGSFVSVSESSGTTVSKGWVQFTGTTGTVKITALTSTTIEFDFTFSNVQPNPSVANNTAAGTFSVSGHASGTLNLQ